MKMSASIILSLAVLAGACTTQHTGSAANRAVGDTRSGATKAALERMTQGLAKEVAHRGTISVAAL